MGEKKVVKVKAQSTKEQPEEKVAVEEVATAQTDSETKAPTAEKQIYKQWWFWLILAGLVLGIFALMTRGGDSSSDGTNQTESGDVAVATAASTVAATEPVNTFNAEEEVKKLQVATYRYSGEYSDGEHYVLQIKNNSEYTLDISAATTYYDASNNMVGTDQETEYDVPAGKEIIIDNYNDSKFDHAEHALSVKETENYEPLGQNLSIESQNIAGDKVVFTVKNNGDQPIEFPKVYALFFKGDQLVDTDYTYAEPEGASSLGAGQTINKELQSYGTGFDRVYLFVNGRSAFTF